MINQCNVHVSIGSSSALNVSYVDFICAEQLHPRSVTPAEDVVGDTQPSLSYVPGSEVNVAEGLVKSELPVPPPACKKAKAEAPVPPVKSAVKGIAAKPNLSDLRTPEGKCKGAAVNTPSPPPKVPAVKQPPVPVKVEKIAPSRVPIARNAGVPMPRPSTKVEEPKPKPVSPVPKMPPLPLPITKPMGPPPLGVAAAVVPSGITEGTSKQDCKMELTNTSPNDVHPRSTPYYIVDSDDDMSSTVADPESPRPTEEEETPGVNEPNMKPIPSMTRTPAIAPKALAFGSVPKPSSKPTQKTEVLASQPPEPVAKTSEVEATAAKAVGELPEPLAKTSEVEATDAKANGSQDDNTPLPSSQPATSPAAPSNTETTKPVETASPPAPTPPHPSPLPTLPPQVPPQESTPSVAAKATPPEGANPEAMPDASKHVDSSTPEASQQPPVKPPADKPVGGEGKGEMDDDEKYVRARYETVRDADLKKYVKKAKAHPLLEAYVCEYLGLGKSLKEAQKDYDFVFGDHDELEELILFDIFLLKHQRKQKNSTPPSPPVTQPKQLPVPPPESPAKKVTFTPLPTPKSVATPKSVVTPHVVDPQTSGATGVGGPVAPVFNVVGAVPWPNTYHIWFDT